MSLDKLLALGAEIVAGHAYVDRVEVGRFDSGTFQTTPEGETLLQSQAESEPAIDPTPPTVRKTRIKQMPMDADVPAPAESTADSA